MATSTCANCIYFAETELQCRYDAPEIGDTKWPTVAATDWCVRHEPEPVTEEEDDGSDG